MGENMLQVLVSSSILFRAPYPAKHINSSRIIVRTVFEPTAAATATNATARVTEPPVEAALTPT